MAPPRDQSGSRRWSVPRVGVGAGATTPPALAPIAAAGIRMRLVLPAVAAALAALAGAANAPTSTRTRAMVHDDDPRSCVAMGKAFQEEGECQAPSTFCNAKKLDLTPLQRESTAESEKPTLVVAWCSESIDWVVDYGCSAANFVINNVDAPGVGFNDATPAAPVGGNPGVGPGFVGQDREFRLVHNRFSPLVRSDVLPGHDNC